MIEWIKQWANSLLCLGIFTAVVELALPKGNVKKYIYVLIGIISVIVIISPFISRSDYEEMSKEVVETISKNVQEAKESSSKNEISEEYLKYQEDLVKNEYVNNLKKSMWNDLTAKGVILDKIEIDIKEDYNIENLSIYVKEYGLNDYRNKQEVMQYVQKYYDISTKNVNVYDEVKIYE